MTQTDILKELQTAFPTHQFTLEQDTLLFIDGLRISQYWTHPSEEYLNLSKEIDFLNLIKNEVAQFIYHNIDHVACPKCGNTSLETTCVGYIGEDRNRATCECGWKGTVHDMVPKINTTAFDKLAAIPYEGHRPGMVLQALGDFMKDNKRE